MATNHEYPYAHAKIPVAQGLEGFEQFAEQYSGFVFCPYVADKDEAGWEISTSRVYMNKVLPRFLYVPVNIAQGNLEGLREFFIGVQDRSDVLAVNITQPHKSSAVLREIFLGDAHAEQNVDTLIRDQSGRLEPYDLNSVAFVEWFKDDVGSFASKGVVLVGVGGVGEPIAKRVASEKPKSLQLIDVEDKSELARHLAESGVKVTFQFSLEEDELPDDLILINAAGKEGAAEDSELQRVIQARSTGIFVDIRPHLDIPIVEEAKRHGWDAYTGHGYLFDNLNLSSSSPAVVSVPTSKDDCKGNGWKSFSDPAFKNQGQCVAYVNHHDGVGKDDDHARNR